MLDGGPPEHKFLGQPIELKADDAFPEWNAAINWPTLYAFNLPPGLYLSAQHELLGVMPTSLVGDFEV